MCYGRMVEKRSETVQQRVETTSATNDKVTMPMAAEAKDKAYVGFMARLQRWIAQLKKEETAL